MRLYRSPLRLLALLACLIFIAEVSVMLFLGPFLSSYPLLTGIIDAILLVIMVYPALYILVMRPMLMHLKKMDESEAALKEQQEFTEHLVQNLSAAALVIGTDHKVRYWNRACEELTGIASSEIVGTDDQWKAFYTEKRPLLPDLIVDGRIPDIHIYYSSFGKSPLINNGIRAESWFDNVGGKRRYLVFEAAPIINKKGEITAVVETIQDVTSVKDAEEKFIGISEGIEMSTGDRFFSLLVENLAKTLDTAIAFIGVMDSPSQRIVRTIAVFAHGSAAGNFEYNLDNTPCSNVADGSLCIYPHGIQRLFPEDVMLADMGIDSYAGTPLFDIAGKLIGLLVVLDSKPIEKPDLVSAMIRIFAMRASAEIQRSRSGRELEEMTSKLKTLIESLRVGVIFEDQDRRTALTNRTLCEMFGIDYDGNIFCQDCRRASEQYRSLFIDPDSFSGRVNEIVNKGEAVLNEELQLADGKVLERDYVPIRSDSNIVGHLWQYRDVTDRRRLENQLLHAQKMEAVGELAGGIAHDFNNILTAVIGYGNLLKMKMASGDALISYVENILNSAEKAANLTQSLLTFSRKQVIDPRPLNLNSIIEKTEKLLSRLIGEEIRLNTIFHDRELIVVADSTQIEQILMNLATNARDAMPDGGELVIETRAIYLDEEFIRKHSGEKTGMYAMISVSDTGSGMDDDIMKKVFEPFFTTKEVGKGTGLGLAIVYGIVKQHDGFIEISSEMGRGTTFRILLPIVAETVQEKRSPDYSHIRKGAETILLVEDDMMVRELNRDVLEKFGYTVISAEDGEEAVRKYLENRGNIQMLLLDVILPKKNGREVYDEISSYDPQIRTLFMSGYTDDLIHKKGIFDSSVNFLPKPVSPMKLLQKVREVLDS